MAIRHNFTVLCNYAITADNDLTSCIDCFQNLMLPAIPAITRFFAVVNSEHVNKNETVRGLRLS